MENFVLGSSFALNLAFSRPRDKLLSVCFYCSEIVTKKYCARIPAVVSGARSSLLFWLRGLRKHGSIVCSSFEKKGNLYLADDAPSLFDPVCKHFHYSMKRPLKFSRLRVFSANVLIAAVPGNSSASSKDRMKIPVISESSSTGVYLSQFPHKLCHAVDMLSLIVSPGQVFDRHPPFWRNV